MKAVPSIFSRKEIRKEKARLSKCIKIAFIAATREGNERIPLVAGVEFRPLAKEHGEAYPDTKWIAIDPSRTRLSMLTEDDWEVMKVCKITRKNASDFCVSYFVVHELLHIKYPKLKESKIRQKTADVVTSEEFARHFRHRT